MADYTGTVFTTTIQYSTPVDLGTPNTLSSTVLNSIDYLITVGYITHYAMRGLDTDGALTYRYWDVINTPDITGSQYSGPRGGATPFSDIVVTRKYLVLI